MADVRALLAAERQSRRINHPALTYTKSGALICNICQLNVKSESLWEGHLRSANHKKNAKAAQEAPPKSLKRRRDDDEDEDQGPRPDVDLDRRKIPKSRAASLAEKQAQVTFKEKPEIVPAVPPVPTTVAAESEPPAEVVEPVEEIVTAPPPAAPVSEPPAAPDPTIDEDEWAAFERDIAPLAQPPPPTGDAPDYSAATISAAPVSAAELAEQQAEDKRKLAELAAEDEQEDERGRLEEEFEIMEDMEERVRKLKEMREKLRAGAVADRPADAGEAQMELDGGTPAKEETKAEESEDDDDESDPDDWYH